MIEKFINAVGFKLVGRKDLSHQYRRYKGVVSWLYCGLFKYDKWRLTFAMFSNSAGMTLQGGALTLLMLYGSLMEKDKSFEILGQSFNARDQQIFLLVLVIIGLLLALGGVMKFYGSKTVMYLSTDFARHCSMRTLTLSASNPPRHPQYGERKYPQVTLPRVAGFNTLARGIRPLLAVSNPLTGFLYGLIVLLYLNPGLTLILLLMSFPTLFGQYVVNYHAVQNEADLQRTQKLSKQELKQEIERLSSQPVLTDAEIGQVKAVYQEGHPSIYSGFYAFRKLAGPKSTLISDISTAFTAILIAAILGNSALEGSITWISFLAYLLFARLTFMSFRGILKAITGFARHYPRIRGTYELLSTSKPGPGPVLEHAPTTIVLSARKARGLGDVKRQVIKSPCVTGIFCKTPISRYNASLYVNALLVADSSIGDFLVSQFDCLPAEFTWDAQSLSQNIGQLIKHRGSDFGVKLLRLCGDATAVPDSLEKTDDLLTVVNGSDREMQERLAAATTVLNGRGSALFIDYRVIQLLRSQWSTLLEWMGEAKFFFICSTNLSEDFIDCAEWHLAISNERAVAVVSAAEARKEMKRLKEFTEIKMVVEEIDSFEDDDDD